MAAELRWTSRPEHPTAVALVLHGGSDNSQRPAKWHNMAVLRMVPVARAVARAGKGTFAVAMLRYAVRGWNGDAASPIADARSALDEVAEMYPGVPIALVGHSMGGRVAFAIADDPRVVEVIGLAPWVVAGDEVPGHEGQKILVIHGVTDHITSASASKAVVEALQEKGIIASFVGLKSADHAMLRRAWAWDHLLEGYLKARFDPEAETEAVSHFTELGARAYEESVITVV